MKAALRDFHEGWLTIRPFVLFIAAAAGVIGIAAAIGYALGGGQAAAGAGVSAVVVVIVVVTCWSIVHVGARGARSDGPHERQDRRRDGDGERGAQEAPRG